MPSILAKIVNLAAKRTETLTGKTWTDNDSNTRYAADVIAHFEDASGKMPGDVGYVGPTVQAVIKDSTGNEIEFSQVQTHTFHDAAVATANGTVFECDGEYTRLLVEITTADADTQEIDFLGSVEGTNYYPLLGAKVGTDGSITTNVKTTSVTSEMWEIDITNRKYIMMDLATLTGEGATVTVVGVVS